MGAGLSGRGNDSEAFVESPADANLGEAIDKDSRSLEMGVSAED